MSTFRVLIACEVLGSEAWEEYSSGLLSLIKEFVLSVWEERKVRLYSENCNVHQSRSSGDPRGVAGGDGELGCLCGKAGTSHLCHGSAHSSGCVVNGYSMCMEYTVSAIMYRALTDLIIITERMSASTIFPSCLKVFYLSTRASLKQICSYRRFKQA